MGLSWTPLPPQAFASLGQEGWPLADYLLNQSDAPAPLPAVAHEEHDNARRRAALQALIECAFPP